MSPAASPSTKPKNAATRPGTAAPPGASRTAVSLPLDGREIKIGRDTANDICLPHPMVSRFHAVVRGTPTDGHSITDTGSANSTYVNGSAVGTAALGEGDSVHIGPYRFYVAGGEFCRASDINKIRIDAHSLGVRMRGKQLLDGVNLTIEPGEFVALIGPSGAGKSTLSRVLSGQLAPTSGHLYMNGFPALKFGAAFERGMGYVSQQILLRHELTVWETLTDQSLMRLPGDSTAEERRVRAGEVLDLMGLTRQRDLRVADLSGGEARRLHVGVELLASPAVVILDEPLASLDPGLTGKFMQLFRRICDKGHTLILITHTLEQIELCDKLVYIHAGRVLFSGAPGGVCDRFGVQHISEVYGRAVETERINEFGIDLNSGHTNAALTRVGTPIVPDIPEHPVRKDSRRRSKRHGRPPQHGEWKAALRHPLLALLLFTRQTRALTLRYFRVYARDRRNMLLLLAQTPLITLLLGLVYKTTILQFPVSFYFCLTVTGIWVGGLASVREAAAELPLLARETKCGMKRLSYIAARTVTAIALSAAQALLFTASVVVIFRNMDFSAELAVLLFAAIFSGNILGLAVSACCGSVSRAISTLPIVLIPQIFFSGILVPFEYMAEFGRHISHLTVSRPVFSVMKKVFFLDRPLLGHSDWTELFILCAGLIIIFWIALKCRTGRRSFG
jgi:ABC-type multidrug transport system ATPase subunit